MENGQDCAKDNKARESLPDILNSIRRARNNASLAVEQVERLEKAFGHYKPPAIEPIDANKNPTLEDPFIEVLENEARDLANYLNDIQCILREKLNLLFGDRS